MLSSLQGKCYKYENINGIRHKCTFPMYRPNTFCLPGGLGSQSQPYNGLTGMACIWRAAKTHPFPALHLHSAHLGHLCSKWSHSPPQTSLIRSKCSSLSLVEASSRYKATFSELKLLRQNRDRWPFHLPWLIFSAVTEMKVLRALKDSKVFTSFFGEPSVFPFAF